MKYFTTILGLTFFTLFIACSPSNDSAKNPYLGLKPPGSTPEVFAEGVVSTAVNNHSPAIFSKDGKDIFWSYYDKGNHVIMHMEETDGKWSEPKIFFKNDTNTIQGNPFYSADFSKLLFMSNRGEPREDGSKDFDFWYIEKHKTGWSSPVLFNAPPNNEMWQLYGSQAKSGNFYFTSKEVQKSTEFQLFVSRFNGKTFDAPVKMPGEFNASKVNWTPYIAPDESYLIFSSDRDGKTDWYDACDLFISFKNNKNEWSKPINMGNTINTDDIERFPYVSPDGKYLFFVRGFGNIYWVSTKIIDELNPYQN